DMVSSTFNDVTNTITLTAPAGGVLTTGAGSYDIKATLEFVREAQVDDAAGSQVLVGQGTSDDIFVSTLGDDVVIGGLGEDTYETR
ncbi:MAG: hypothetical protein VW500_05965, partial [Aquiluna sp.]